MERILRGKHMLFNSYIFIFLFLPSVLVGYYGLSYGKKYKFALCWLIVMSMLFYGYNYNKISMYYLGLLVLSILLNFVLVKGLSKTDVLMWRRVILCVGLLLNLGILFYFKYYDFFMENINAAFGTDIGLLRVALPLGISFYTFQQLSYVIDSYKKECESYSLLEYAAYVSFFPQLVAGPIVYHDELIPQLRDEKNHHLNYENLSKGIYAFSMGLAKKVLIADTFSKVVTIGYGNIEELNAVSALLIMVCYSMQIYFDFSGYCDIALGIGYMFNVELPINFNSPYKAASIVEFWSRWHMTLTRFFTKYIYIPLGGSRRGTIKRYRNIMIVFLVSGIWHGANWTYILWGVINGGWNVLEKLLERFFRWVPRAVRVFVTFICLLFSMSLFRSNSIAQARQLWGRLKVFGDGVVYEPVTSAFNELTEMRLLYRIGFGGMIEAYPWMGLALFTMVVLLACFFMKNTQEKVRDMRYTVSRMVAVIGLMIWSILSLSDVSEFLYFNF